MTGFVPCTPSTHRQQPGADSAGLSAVPGLVAGTPVALQGSRRPRQPLREMQHNPQPSHIDNFTTGVGLSSRLKTGQGFGAPAAFVPTVRPRGRRLPVPAQLPECLLMILQSRDGLVFHCLAQHRPCSTAWEITTMQQLEWPVRGALELATIFLAGLMRLLNNSVEARPKETNRRRNLLAFVSFFFLFSSFETLLCSTARSLVNVHRDFARTEQCSLCLPEA